jgi:hypothetical protein
MTCKVIDMYEGEHLSNILVYEYNHLTKKGGMCEIKVSFHKSLIGFMDQSCSETPLIMATE